MLLLFLFIGNFFTPIFCLIECLGGPNCYIKLNFNEKIPGEKELLKTCLIINKTQSCSVYVQIDYQDQQVKILFDQSSHDKNLSKPFIDLFATNHQASIIRRYTVKVQMHNNNYKIQLNVLIQCDYIDKCQVIQLRHFWFRLIALNKREKNYLDFYKLLYSNQSNVQSCFNDQINQTKQCTRNNDLCWASHNTYRKCRQAHKNHSYDFIYSYNKVDIPHKLTDENITYRLACHVNNCNNNETINELSKIARQFAEYSLVLPVLNTTKQSSLAIKPIRSYLDTFCFGLFIISKIFFV